MGIFVNGILTQIRELNSSIRKSEIHGENALELRDERNLLIDELSSYMKIKATEELYRLTTLARISPSRR